MATNSVPSRYDYGRNDELIICKDIQALIKNYKLTMLDRVMQMFEFEGLPSTIPKKDLLFILFTNGSATVTKVNNDLYAFRGGLGGVLNEYYLPTISIVSNPYLRFNKSLLIGKECVVIPCDAMYQGLMPLFDKFSSLLASIDVSLYWATINTRVPKVFETDNDNVKEAFSKFYDHLEKGDKIESIAGSSFIDGLKSFDFATSGNTDIKNLVELRQYTLAQWFQELGLNANYNMKRESLNENEINADVDILTPYIDNILENLQKGFDEVNVLYGTNIKVSKANVWKEVEREIEERNTQQEEATQEQPKGVTEDEVSGND